MTVPTSNGKRLEIHFYNKSTRNVFVAFFSYKFVDLNLLPLKDDKVYNYWTKTQRKKHHIEWISAPIKWKIANWLCNFVIHVFVAFASFLKLAVEDCRKQNGKSIEFSHKIDKFRLSNSQISNQMTQFFAHICSGYHLQLFLQVFWTTRRPKKTILQMWICRVY